VPFFPHKIGIELIKYFLFSNFFLPETYSFDPFRKIIKKNPKKFDVFVNKNAM